MCIEYNEFHYGGMYNVYVKRIFFFYYKNCVYECENRDRCQL